MVSLIFIRSIVIYPVENTIHSLHNRGKMVLIAIVVVHPDWSWNWPSLFAQKDHLKPKSSFCLFLWLLLRRHKKSDLSRFSCNWCFLLVTVTRKIRVLKRKKNKTGEQKLRYFKIDMNDVQLRIWSYAQKLKVLR